MNHDAIRSLTIAARACNAARDLLAMADENRLAAAAPAIASPINPNPPTPSQTLNAASALEAQAGAEIGNAMAMLARFAPKPSPRMAS